MSMDIPTRPSRASKVFKIGALVNVFSAPIGSKGGVLWSGKVQGAEEGPYCQVILIRHPSGNVQRVDSARVQLAENADKPKPARKPKRVHQERSS